MLDAILQFVHDGYFWKNKKLQNYHHLNNSYLKIRADKTNVNKKASDFLSRRMPDAALYIDVSVLSISN